MARKINTKELNAPTPVIIGAGITEKWYFSHLRDLENLRIRIRSSNFGSEGFFYLEKRLKPILANGSVAICVFDMDTVENNPTEKTKFEKFKRKYVSKTNVIICDSLPSIEYWFLIHYEDTNRHFSNSKEVIRSIEPYIQNYKKEENFLKNQEWVKGMDNDGKNRKKAIDRAKQYSEREGSYTNVYKAIEYLMETK
ncbi:MAG: RloB family protein [Bacteroidales bacterium]|nr:RloB family protein [Bacteroidales bacterium]